MTADGVGEWATTTVVAGNKMIWKLKRNTFSHSLGLFTLLTYYLGFKVNSEYKLMLAPYKMQFT